MQPLNRRTTPELELELGRRSALAGVSNLFLFCLFRYGTGFPAGPPPGSDVAGLVTAGVMLFRWLLYFCQRSLPMTDRNRRRWKFVFRLQSSLFGLTWGLLAFSTTRHYGLSYPTLISIITVIGVSTASVQGFGLDLAQGRFFVFLIIVPQLMADLMQLGEPGFRALAGIMLLYLTYLTLMVRRVHDLLWGALDHQELLKAERDRIMAVFNAVPGFVCWVDDSGSFVGANRRFLEAAIGENGHASFEDFSRRLREFLESGKDEQLDETQLELGGVRRWCVLALKKYPVSRGFHAIAIALDIESQKRAEVELEKARANAYSSARLAELGVMAAGISHEISNPLQALSSGITLLRARSKNRELDRDALLTEIHQSCDRSEKVIDRIAKIVQGLRVFSRDGKRDPMEGLTLQSILEDVLELCSSRLSSLKIRLEVRGLGSSNFLSGRRAQIGQVFLNILNNAVDAIVDLPEKWIAIEVSENDSWIETSFTDSGGGIPSKVREQMMIPFFTTKEVGKGTGLGLSISKSIIEDHGGQLFVDAACRNTRFIVRLPASAKTGLSSRSAAPEERNRMPV